MRISKISIKNFKSIRELTIKEIESALIIVGKNSTGKTVILDAILAVAGKYSIQRRDFRDPQRNIEIALTISLEEQDLHQMNQLGIVSKYRRFEVWKQQFQTRLPSFQNGTLTFTFIANENGKIRYDDGYHKNNNWILQILPKIHYIDHTRDVRAIEEDIFFMQGQAELKELRENRCMFDKGKSCINCFQCIGVIEKKMPDQLSILEASKLLQYKLLHINIDSFMKRLNYYFRKNSGSNQEILYQVEFLPEKIYEPKTCVYYREQKRILAV